MGTRSEAQKRCLLCHNKITGLVDFVICTIGFVVISVFILTGRWIQSLDGDMVPQTYSLFVYAFNALKNGELPLWNPALWGGLPFYANPITESFYPINWLLCALFYNANTGLVSYLMIAWNLILHLTGMFVGVYVLCVRFKLSRFSSTVAALISVLNMSMMNGSMLTWVVSLDAICYLPWILYFTVGMIEAKE